MTLGSLLCLNTLSSSVRQCLYTASIHPVCDIQQARALTGLVPSASSLRVFCNLGFQSSLNYKSPLACFLNLLMLGSLHQTPSQLGKGLRILWSVFPKSSRVNKGTEWPLIALAPLVSFNAPPVQWCLCLMGSHRCLAATLLSSKAIPSLHAISLIIAYTGSQVTVF